MTSNQEIAIPVKRWRVLWNLIVRLAILGSTVVFWRKALLTSLPDDTRMIALVVVLTVYSIFSGLGWLISLLDPRPALVVGYDGVWYRNSPFKSQLIYWQDMTRIEIFTYRNPKLRSWPLLLIKVANPGDYVAQASILQWPILKFNQLFHGTPIVIPMRLLKRKTDEVKDIIFAGRRQYRIRTEGE